MICELQYRLSVIEFLQREKSCQRVNLLYRLLCVISVYFTLYILLLFLFFRIKALCGLASTE